MTIQLLSLIGEIASHLPATVVIIRPAEIIDLICITKGAVSGGRNFRAGVEERKKGWGISG
jgi:hypothetical protein